VFFAFGIRVQSASESVSTSLWKIALESRFIDQTPTLEASFLGAQHREFFVGHAVRAVPALARRRRVRRASPTRLPDSYVYYGVDETGAKIDRFRRNDPEPPPASISSHDSKQSENGDESENLSRTKGDA
jgi:hypothetical protein